MKNGANETFAQSLKCAIRGLIHVFRTERNARIHVLAAISVVTLGVVFNVSITEWALLLIAISLVFVGEMINTVAERIVDLMILEHHPLAEQAKDVAAGAVLVSSLAALGIGILVFGPHLIAIIN